ncbi:MAG TPA: hypothetical protein VL026_09230 [Rhizomicrobium sp.]|nr:hypothetical protein [Rhizomicrobium sp.]
MTAPTRAVPANTLDPQILPPTPFDPKALLAEQLQRCHFALLECFDCGSNSNLPMSTQMDALKLAAKLMKSSMALVAALQPREGAQESRRHVIVEHVVTPTPLSTTKNRKTNSGAADSESTHG